MHGPLNVKIYTRFIHSYISRLAYIPLFILVLEGWFMYRSCNNSLRMAKHVGVYVFYVCCIPCSGSLSPRHGASSGCG